MGGRVRNLAGVADTELLGREIADRLRPGDAVLLDGPLGAGKTVLVRALLRRLAGDMGMEVPSPSYTLVQTYDTRLGPVHHFDLWRLDGPQALPELGWEEARGDIVVVEWPDRLGPLRPEGALSIMLSVRDSDVRRAELNGWEDRA